ncbi:MAG: DUF1801 domain-containing protein [candidate division SR1 bacterium]|nr:DUF1801 domain-containing protein [candidate division SR1 bacterium]
MINSKPNSKADWYFEKETTWKAVKVKLREISLDLGLGEEVKWGKPTYTFDGQMLFLIHTFKDYVAILFFKGSLMNDPNDILIQQTENVQAGRQIRFTSVEQIDEMKNTIKNYIIEAIRIEKSGMQVEFQKATELVYPEEFNIKLDEITGLRDAFEKLTPGRQKGYYLYFIGAKQSKTRLDRVAKSIPYILSGKGRLKGNGFEK